MPSQTIAARQAAHPQTPSRGRTITVSSLVGALLLLGFHSSWQAGVAASEAQQERLLPVAKLKAGGEAIQAAAVQPQTVAASAPAAVKEVPDAAPVAASGKETAQAVLDQWVRAWSNRQVDQYLGLYAEGFKPENGLSRDAWAQSRRQKIESRKSISVAIRDLEISEEGEKRLSVRFLQDYRADNYSESGTPKQLVLALEDGAWRIVAESSAPTKQK